MKEKTFQVIVSVVLVLALALGAIALYQVGQPVEYQVMSVSGYLLTLKDGAGTVKFSVTDAGNATVAGTFTSNGAGDFDSTLNVDGTTTLVGLLYPSFANETITDGETLTPTKTIYALDSAGAVTMTLAASATEGQLLILIGDDANNITVNDTNVRTNDGGVQVIGQYDVITWVYQDSEWIEISESNNS